MSKALFSMFAAMAGDGIMARKRDAGPSDGCRAVTVTNPAAHKESKRKQKKRQGKQSRAKRKKARNE